MTREQPMTQMRKQEMALTGLKDLMRGQTYVEVRLVKNTPDGKEEIQTKFTHTMEGNYPDWNETLEFVIRAEDRFKGFTEEEFIKNNTTLYFSIFDRCMTTRKDPYTNVYESVIENKFLGSFSIGLISILQNSPKMEGMVRVNRPLDLHGYDVLNQGIFGFSMEKHQNQREESNLIPSYVNLTITCDPSIELPAENEYDYYPGAEPTELLLFGTQWVKTIQKNQRFAKRVIKVFGENLQGQSVFLCRFIRSQELPPNLVASLEGEESQDKHYAIQNAARFVSLIPFLDDNAAFDNVPDLWCTSQEFLDLGYGDYEEHAILLCNYFNKIDETLNNGEVESYIILGKAVPEGYTTYVLRRDKKTNHVEIWNALKGEAVYFDKTKTTRRCFCLPIASGFNVEFASDPNC